jgi:hypothetical protein
VEVIEKNCLGKLLENACQVNLIRKELRVKKTVRRTCMGSLIIFV